MLREKNEYAGKVESSIVEKDELAKVVANLQAQLRELESKLEEFEHRASKERKANKELEEELLVFKKHPWSNMKRAFIRLSDKSSSSPRILTWVLLTH